MEDRTSMFIFQYYFKVHKSRAHLEPSQTPKIEISKKSKIVVFAKMIDWLTCEIYE